MLPFLEAALAEALGRSEVRIESTTELEGGCIHEARRLRTSEGDYFAKWSLTSADDIFLREAEGLRVLRAAAVDLTIPRVFAAASREGERPAFLILEYLPPSNGGALDDERLGRGLAQMHRATADRFGFPSASYCGSTRQDNSSRESWPAFYRQCRLEPILEALDRAGRVSVDDRNGYDRLMRRLDELVAKGSPPALIHGDLWSGNVLSSDAGPALVDPACVFGDREMEFGITTLFGGLNARAFAAYEEAWPLPAGWRDRNPLYQLYHLLNHALLFGGGYAEEARRIAIHYAG